MSPTSPRRRNKNQLRLDFYCATKVLKEAETFEDALEETFPIHQATEDELFRFFIAELRTKPI
jgi:hypothetical protein